MTCICRVGDGPQEDCPVHGREPLSADKRLTIGKLVVQTALGEVKERTLTSEELAQVQEDLGRKFEAAREAVRLRYFPGPLRFIEPTCDSDALGPRIVDANGSLVASLYWPCHPPEDTDAAEQETYALGRAMAEVAK